MSLLTALMAGISPPALAAPVTPVVAPKVVTDPMQSFEQWMKFQPPMPSDVKTPPPNTSASLTPASVQLQQQQALAEIAKVKKARPHNNRTLDQDDRFRAMLNINGIDVPPPSDKNYVVHWTADEFRYKNLNKDGSKNFMYDKDGQLISKTAKDIEDSMKGGRDSVNKIATGMRGPNPSVSDFVPFGNPVGHVQGAKKEGQKPITGSEQTESGNTIFETNATNKNSYGIEVAFDPSMPGDFSEKGKTVLRNHLIQTMIEQGIPPSQLFAHGEIQRDKSGGKKAGEMVDFMKDFKTNLFPYVEQYQKQKMDSFSKRLDSLGQKK